MERFIVSGLQGDGIQVTLHFIIANLNNPHDGLMPGEAGPIKKGIPAVSRNALLTFIRM